MNKERARIILASNSPRRKLLLKQIGLRFEVHPSRVEEKFDPSLSPRLNARRIALEKAMDVARLHRKGIVVGADTIVVLGRKVLGKPKSVSEAKRMLRLLSGRTHIVYTGLALVDAELGKNAVAVEKTAVTFRKLEKKEIVRYVASGAPMDKAGAYGIQDDYGAVFVEKINGCFYNVMGFPLARFFSMLRKFRRQRL
ncbi:MAG: septum formation protein Maf [Ignavibacteriales bacterium]|nr:septum formation protein Maf [Ignavibacteriales bacterium]